MPSAAEVSTHFDEYLEQARQKPVVIEHTGGSLVMMSSDEYERLQTADDYVWGTAAQEAAKSGYLGTKSQ